MLWNNSNRIGSESIELSEELEMSKKITDNAEKAILKYDEKMKLAKNILTRTMQLQPYRKILKI